jgi:hypothetical protein
MPYDSPRPLTCAKTKFVSHVSSMQCSSTLQGLRGGDNGLCFQKPLENVSMKERVKGEGLASGANSRLLRTRGHGWL